MAGWNGLSVSVANALFSVIGVEVFKNEEEGCYIARHPKREEVIRRKTVTGCGQAILKDWMVLK